MTLLTCEWLQKRRNEHIFSLMLAKHLMTFLLYFLTSSPSLFYKKDWYPDSDKMGVFLETLVHHFLGLLAF